MRERALIFGMATVLQGPEREGVEQDQSAFNLAVWSKILADPDLAKLPYRLETDAFGQIIMSPPPAPSHGSMQSRISRHLGNLMRDGEVISECPVSTSAGVKAADVAWCSDGIWVKARELPCFLEAPEICVEIVSPSNTQGEIDQKKHLYFEAGAKEVWICSEAGTMRFHESPDRSKPASDLCPLFPARVER